MLVAKLCLCDPGTAACQAPVSMGFSRQEHWSGLPFSSPGPLPDPGRGSNLYLLRWQVDAHLGSPWINIINPYKVQDGGRSGLLLRFNRCRNWDSETLSNFSKVTQLVSLCLSQCMSFMWCCSFSLWHYLDFRYLGFGSSRAKCKMVGVVSSVRARGVRPHRL